MSISPAMLNRAKKIPVRPVVAHFMGQEYTTYIPAKPIITVEQFLTSFAQDNLKGKFNYTDLEIIDIIFSYLNLIKKLFMKKEIS